jgi:hypothetical protein
MECKLFDFGIEDFIEISMNEKNKKLNRGFFLIFPYSFYLHSPRFLSVLLYSIPKLGLKGFNRPKILGQYNLSSPGRWRT